MGGFKVNWQWMPGMRVNCDALGFGFRLISAHDGNEWLMFDESTDELSTGEPHTPDLTDPATFGCLLDVIREVCGSGLISLDVDISPLQDGSGYNYTFDVRHEKIRGPVWHDGSIEDALALTVKSVMEALS